MKKKVLLIHTGGTIGMVRDENHGVLKPDSLYESIHQMIPRLSDIADINVEIPFLCDSSDIGISHWQQIAALIGEAINTVDGVVITHGTDTMAYTASALSYMLSNLPIPVILTGAQKPLSDLRSDARANLINAVELATSAIHEVAVFFDAKLMRGNRSTKTHINHFDAFNSPNYPLLAKVGIDVEIYHRNLLNRSGMFHIFTRFDHNLAIFRLFPACHGQSMIVPPETRAVLLVGYGAGNIPCKEDSIIRQVDIWQKEGKLIFLSSETPGGHLSPQLYEGGALLNSRGILHSGDMTHEATVIKLMFLLGHHQNPDDIRHNFETSLAGEVTLRVNDP